MGFPKQEYQSGLSSLSPGDLPDPGIELASPALAGKFLTTEPPGKPMHSLATKKIHLCETANQRFNDLDEQSITIGLAILIISIRENSILRSQKFSQNSV